MYIWFPYRRPNSELQTLDALNRLFMTTYTAKANFSKENDSYVVSRSSAKSVAIQANLLLGLFKQLRLVVFGGFLLVEF